MIDLFKMVKSIEFCNEEFKSFCTPDNSRSPSGDFVAQLTAIQLKLNQGIHLLSPVDEHEASVLDGETGEVLCILRK